MTVFRPSGPAFIPGQGERPEDRVFAPFRATGPNPETSPAMQAGLSAFLQGYYWESHELWEPLWAALPPASAERELMRGLIQLANAGLKGRMGRRQARILKLADAAIAEALLRGGGPVLGFGPEDLAVLRARAAGEASPTGAVS